MSLKSVKHVFCLNHVSKIIVQQPGDRNEHASRIYRVSFRKLKKSSLVDDLRPKVYTSHTSLWVMNKWVFQVKGYNYFVRYRNWTSAVTVSLAALEKIAFLVRFTVCSVQLLNERPSKWALIKNWYPLVKCCTWFCNKINSARWTASFYLFPHPYGRAIACCSG